MEYTKNTATHMGIHADDDNIIESFEYSTYQSTGSAYGDMVSRPKLLPDRHDEAIDTLLHLYDIITNEDE